MSQQDSPAPNFLVNNLKFTALIPETKNAKLCEFVWILKNKNRKLTRRVVVINEKEVILLHDMSFKVKSRVAVSEINDLAITLLQDNFLVLHLDAKPDIVMVSSKKVYIISEIAAILETIYNRPESHIIQFSNKHVLKCNDKQNQTIAFSEVEGGVLTVILAK